jgi:hypothetical protein
LNVRRTLLIAGLAIAVFGGGSLALIWMVTLPLTPLPVEQSAAPAPSPVAPSAVATAPPPKSAGSKSVAMGDALAAREASFTALPGTGPLKTGRAMRKLLRKGGRRPTPDDTTAFASPWNQLQSRVAPCVDANAQRAVGAPEPQVQRPEGQAMLLLDLEFRGGVPQIVDVSFLSRSGVSDAVRDCAVKALRGQVISLTAGNELPAGTEGEETRVQIPFPLQL